MFVVVVIFPAELLPATSKLICINTTADLTVNQPISLSGVTYEWHSASNTLSSTLVANPAAVGTAGTYYLFAKNNTAGCFSTASVPFTLSIVSVTQATLTGASTPTYTIGDIAVGLNASTSNPTYSLRWYTASTGGVALTAPVLPSTATAGITNYYVEQYDANASFCTSNPRQLATVTVKPLAPIVTNITYCQNDLSTALTATGTSLKWYTTSNGGNFATLAPTPSTGTATPTTYYVTQTVNGVESDRAALLVTINPTPATPSAISGATTTSTGSSVVYSVTNDISATGYVWTLPNSWTGSSTTNDITATIGLSGGQISVKAKNGSCASPASTLTVNILNVTNPPATTDITSTSTTDNNITTDNNVEDSSIALVMNPFKNLDDDKNSPNGNTFTHKDDDGHEEEDADTDEEIETTASPRIGFKTLPTKSLVRNIFNESYNSHNTNSSLGNSAESSKHASRLTLPATTVSEDIITLTTNKIDQNAPDSDEKILEIVKQ